MTLTWGVEVEYHKNIFTIICNIVCDYQQWTWVKRNISRHVCSSLIFIFCLWVLTRLAFLLKEIHSKLIILMSTVFTFLVRNWIAKCLIKWLDSTLRIQQLLLLCKHDYQVVFPKWHLLHASAALQTRWVLWSPAWRKLRLETSSLSSIITPVSRVLEFKVPVWLQSPHSCLLLKCCLAKH